MWNLPNKETIREKAQTRRADLELDKKSLWFLFPILLPAAAVRWAYRKVRRPKANAANG